MTISTTSSVQAYNGDGTTQVFPFPYEFLDQAHLVVNLIDIASGTVTPQTITANYTVSGVGNPAGGSVTMLSAPAVGKELKIQRVVPLVQNTDFNSGDQFSPGTLDNALDYITMALQQISDLASGASVAPVVGGGNTFINLGAGHGVYLQTLGSQVQLKGIVAGANVTVTENGTDITIATTGLTGALLAANNLSDVATRQTALNSLTAVGAATNEFVLTKDTATGNAIWKAQATGGGGEANTMSSSGAGASIVQAKIGVNLPIKSFIAGTNMAIVQNANDLTFNATGEANSAVNIGVAGTGIFTTKSGVNIQLKGLAAGNGVSVASNATDITYSVNQAFQFAFTGQPKFNDGADVADHPASSVPHWAVRVNQTVPASAGATKVLAGLVCNTSVPSTSYDFGWNALFYTTTAATAQNAGKYGESVGMYSKGYTTGPAPIWAGVFESQNLGVSDPIMFGIEIDLCSPGLDPSNLKKGLAIFFGDAYPNTSTGAGSNTRQYAGIVMAPFEPRNQLGYGVVLNGNISEGFAASNTGLTALSAYGTFSTAAIYLANATATPIAIDMAGGSWLKFRSGTLGGPVATWYSGAFVPTYAGALAIKVDGSTLYIPVCSNHP